MKNIKHNIGYPESVKNVTYLDEMYKQVSVDSSFEIHRIITKHGFFKERNDIAKVYM